MTNLKLKTCFIAGVTILGLAAGLAPGFAENGLPLSAEGYGMEKVMRVIGNVNLSQVDAKAAQSMIDVLDTKSQMYQTRSKLLIGRPTAGTTHHTAIRRPARLPRSF